MSGVATALGLKRAETRWLLNLETLNTNPQEQEDNGKTDYNFFNFQPNFIIFSEIISKQQIYKCTKFQVIRTK
jgi:hypothetical protein